MRLLRIGVRVGLAVVALAVLYVGITFVQVWWASRQDDASPADAIVVAGAAQWNGRPSPVLQARLDHAAELWRDGVAPVIVVTGGKQVGDTFTQGFTGYDYLKDQGVPEEALRVEVDGSDTYTELSATRNILDAEGLGNEVVLVTSPYHAYRARAIAGEVGLSAHVSPSGDASSLRSLARETAGVSIGRIIGYRRLSNWTS
ncbi:MAG: YdcF family protein [Acidimicrobiales bacterium]|nr:YdcF family protein [Acidimicrobiales bacterium]